MYRWRENLAEVAVTHLVGLSIKDRDNLLTCVCVAAHKTLIVLQGGANKRGEG